MSLFRVISLLVFSVLCFTVGATVSPDTITPIKVEIDMSKTDIMGFDEKSFTGYVCRNNRKLVTDCNHWQDYIYERFINPLISDTTFVISDKADLKAVIKVKSVAKDGSTECSLWLYMNETLMTVRDLSVKGYPKGMKLWLYGLGMQRIGALARQQIPGAVDIYRANHIIIERIIEEEKEPPLIPYMHTIKEYREFSKENKGKVYTFNGVPVVFVKLEPLQKTNPTSILFTYSEYEHNVLGVMHTVTLYPTSDYSYVSVDLLKGRFDK